MVLFCAAAVMLIVTGNMAIEPINYDRTLQVIALLLAIGLPALGFNLFKQRLQAMAGDTISGRIRKYKTASLIRWALIEMPALFAIVSFLISGNYAYFGLAVALVLLFAATNPSKTKVIFQLQLNDQEVADIESGSSK